MCYLYFCFHHTMPKKLMLCSLYVLFPVFLSIPVFYYTFLTCEIPCCTYVLHFWWLFVFNILVLFLILVVAQHCNQAYILLVFFNDFCISLVNVDVVENVLFTFHLRYARSHFAYKYSGKQFYCTQRHSLTHQLRPAAHTKEGSVKMHHYLTPRPHSCYSTLPSMLVSWPGTQLSLLPSLRPEIMTSPAVMRAVSVLFTNTWLSDSPRYWPLSQHPNRTHLWVERVPAEPTLSRDVDSETPKPL